MACHSHSQSRTQRRWSAGVAAVAALAVASASATAVRGGASASGRSPRYLVWPPGLGNKLQVICGFGVPIDAPKVSLTYGLILKTNYVLPNNATQFTDPYVAFARRHPSAGASRWHLYAVAEALLNRLGAGGRVCLLRAVCEAAEAPLSRDTLLGELVHVLLTPTSTSDEPIDESAREYYAAERRGRELRSGVPDGSETTSCRTIYQECDTGLLDAISTSLLHSIM